MVPSPMNCERSEKMMNSARFDSFLAAACFAYNAGIHPVRFFRAGKTWFVYWLEQAKDAPPKRKHEGETR